MTTYYQPAHEPGDCDTCDWVRTTGSSWIEVPAPPDCSQCIELPGGTYNAAAATPGGPKVQANLLTPHAMPHAPAIEGTVARLPMPHGAEHAPAVTRPGAGRRPGIG